MPTANWTNADASWLGGTWGIFTHFLADRASDRTASILAPDEWDRRVDCVNVDQLAEHIAETGARYHIMTIGQNSGYYCSPNPIYDALVGGNSRLSRRDLIGELADALSPRNVRLIAYLPSHAPAKHREAVERLRCTPAWDASAWGLVPGSYIAGENEDERLSAFQRHWEAICRAWGERWGKRVHGWWIDGCYHDARMYRTDDEGPSFRSFTTALRAGNNQRIVTYNPGIKNPIICFTGFEDYTAGELSEPIYPQPWWNPIGHIDHSQLHLLTYLGQYWGQGDPRFGAGTTREWTRTWTNRGAAVSWDVPILGDGSIADAHRRVLNSIRG